MRLPDAPETVKQMPNSKRRIPLRNVPLGQLVKDLIKHWKAGMAGLRLPKSAKDWNTSQKILLGPGAAGRQATRH